MASLMNRVKALVKARWKIKAARYDENKRLLQVRIDMPHGENIKGNILSNWYDIHNLQEYYIGKKRYRVTAVDVGLSNILEIANAEIEIPEMTEQYKEQIEKQQREAYKDAKRKRR